MNEWIRFVLTLFGVVVSVLIEDYICWRLWVIRRSLPTAPPSYEPLNTKCPDYANSQANKQSVDKTVVTKELDGRTNKPKHKTDDSKGDYPHYYFLSGFGHIPFLAKTYCTAIISKAKQRKQPNANRTEITRRTPARAVITETFRNSDLHIDNLLNK